MVTGLLILHSIVGVALLGALTHQLVSLLRRSTQRAGNFLERYSSVNARTFTVAVSVLYVVQVALGAIVYPAYRLQVRIPFEEMSLGWAVGLFELKEHFAGIGLGMLPLYASTWQSPSESAQRRDRLIVTALLTLIVWWDFLVGHVLNNMRGLA